LISTRRRAAPDSVTPGVGARLLGSRTVNTDGFGKVSFDLHFSAPRSPAATATSTGPDGSTSEFSPCLTMGTSAPAFVKSGVTAPGGLSVGGSSGPLTDDSLSARLAAAFAAVARARAKPVPATATIHPFCPPITTGSCTGTLRLNTVGHRAITIVARKFRLAPGELITIAFRIPAAVQKRLRREHRIRVRVTIAAHDGAGHTRTTAKVLTLEGTYEACKVCGREDDYVQFRDGRGMVPLLVKAGLIPESARPRPDHQGERFFPDRTVDFFLYMLGNVVSPIGRNEPVPASNGVDMTRDIGLVGLLLAEAGLATTREHTFGNPFPFTKRLRPYLSDEGNALLESLPPLIATIDSAIDGFLAVAEIFLPRAS
jgi:hypothetical protein